MLAMCKNDAGDYVSASIDLSKYTYVQINATVVTNDNKKMNLSEMLMVS